MSRIPYLPEGSFGQGQNSLVPLSVKGLRLNRDLYVGREARFRATDSIHSGVSSVAVIGAPSFLASSGGDGFLKHLASEGLSIHTFQVHGEPAPDVVDSLTEALRRNSVEVVIAVGGGSVLDAAKAASAMAAEPDGTDSAGIEDFLEGVGDRAPSGATLPLIAIPTTSGTGSEATKNAVIGRPGPGGFKRSLRHDNYVPFAALLDPELTVSAPWRVTAFCGMDAFTQLLESWLSTEATPVTDLFAWEGLGLFISCFPPLLQTPENLELRLGLSLAAYYSGITLANAGLGTIHALAGTLGALHPAPHSVLCATLLLETLNLAVEGLREHPHSPEGQTGLAKIARLGQHITGESLEQDEGIEAFMDWLIGIDSLITPPGLKSLGYSRDMLANATTGGNKTFPYPFTERERMTIMDRRY